MCSLKFERPLVFKELLEIVGAFGSMYIWSLQRVFLGWRQVNDHYCHLLIVSPASYVQDMLVIGPSRPGRTSYFDGSS